MDVLTSEFLASHRDGRIRCRMLLAAGWASLQRLIALASAASPLATTRERSTDAPATDFGERAGFSKPLVAILIAGLLVRIALVAAFGGRPPVIEDAIDYNRLATGILETGSYVDASGHLTSLRPPLYPAMVAGIYKVFGAENFLAVSAVQAAISLFTVWLVYLLATELYSPRVGHVAAAAVCFYPSLVVFNVFLLSEVLFTFFVVAGALASVRLLKTGALPWAVCLGASLGLGALTRSVLWLFAPLLCGGLAVTIHAAPGRRLATAALTLATFGAVIAPWAYRNTVAQKTLTFIDVMGGRNVMMGNYEYTPLDRSWATISTETGDRAWNVLLAEATPNYGQLTQGQIDKVAMKYGVSYFFGHPGTSMLRSLVKFFNFWQLDREIIAGLRQGLFGDVSLATTLVLAVLVCGSYVAAIFAGLFGAMITPPLDRTAHIMLLGWIAFPCAIHTIAFAHSRYRLPLMPIVLVYAAAVLVDWRRVFAARGSWQFALASAACLVLVVSWVREFAAVDLKWFT